MMNEITEHSAGAFLFNEKSQKFLLLKRVNNPFWEFPKGHIEKNEEIHETLKREIEEETGIKAVSIIKEIGKLNFEIKKENFVKKRVISYYLVKTSEELVELSGEHSDYIWLNHQDVIDYLEFEDIKKIFKEIDTL